MSTVDIKASGKFELSIEWVGSVTNDMIADSVIALVLGVDRSPASVKKTTSESPHSHSHSHHHHLPHPQAEPIDLPSLPIDLPSLSILDKQEELDVEPIESNDPSSFPLPTRLDRLIAFLDSYFGQVELVMREATQSHSEIAAKCIAIVEDIDQADKIEEKEAQEEQFLVEKVDEAKVEVEEKQEAGQVEFKMEEEEEKTMQIRAPIIRVRLDDHTADVTIEDLVSHESTYLTPPRFSSQTYPLLSIAE